MCCGENATNENCRRVERIGKFALAIGSSGGISQCCCCCFCCCRWCLSRRRRLRRLASVACVLCVLAFAVRTSQTAIAMLADDCRCVGSNSAHCARSATPARRLDSRALSVALPQWQEKTRRTHTFCALCLQFNFASARQVWRLERGNDNAGTAAANARAFHDRRFLVCYRKRRLQVATQQLASLVHQRGCACAPSAHGPRLNRTFFFLSADFVSAVLGTQCQLQPGRRCGKKRTQALFFQLKILLYEPSGTSLAVQKKLCLTTDFAMQNSLIYYIRLIQY